MNDKLKRAVAEALEARAQDPHANLAEIARRHGVQRKRLSGALHAELRRRARRGTASPREHSGATAHERATRGPAPSAPASPAPVEGPPPTSPRAPADDLGDGLGEIPQAPAPEGPFDGEVLSEDEAQELENGPQDDAPHRPTQAEVSAAAVETRGLVRVVSAVCTRIAHDPLDEDERAGLEWSGAGYLAENQARLPHGVVFWINLAEIAAARIIPPIVEAVRAARARKAAAQAAEDVVPIQEVDPAGHDPAVPPAPAPAGNVERDALDGVEFV